MASYYLEFGGVAPRYVGLETEAGEVVGGGAGESCGGVVIGRGGDALLAPDLVVSDDLSVSRHHARLCWDGRQWHIAALPERNEEGETIAGQYTEVQVNNHPLPGDHNQPLEDGDKITLKVQHLFFYQGTPPQSPPHRTAPLQQGQEQFRKQFYDLPRIYKRLEKFWALWSRQPSPAPKEIAGGILQLFQDAFAPSYLELRLHFPQQTKPVHLLLGADEPWKEEAREKLLAASEEEPLPGGRRPSLSFLFTHREQRTGYLLLMPYNTDDFGFTEPQLFLFTSLTLLCNRLLDKLFERQSPPEKVPVCSASSGPSDSSTSSGPSASFASSDSSASFASSDSSASSASSDSFDSFAAQATCPLGLLCPEKPLPLELLCSLPPPARQQTGILGASSSPVPPNPLELLQQIKEASPQKDPWCKSEALAGLNVHLHRLSRYNSVKEVLDAMGKADSNSIWSPIKTHLGPRHLGFSSAEREKWLQSVKKLLQKGSSP